MRKSFKKGLALVLSAALALGAPVAVGTQEAKAATTPAIVEVTKTISDAKDAVVAPSWAAGSSDYYKLTGDFDVTFNLTLDDMSNITTQNWFSPVLCVTDEAGAKKGAPTPGAADAAKYIILRCDSYGWRGEHNPNTNPADANYDKDLFEFTKKWDLNDEWRSAMQNSESFSINVKRAGQKLDVDWTLVSGGKTYEQAGTTSSLNLEDSIYLFMMGDTCNFTINSIDYKTADTPTASPEPTTPAASGGAVSGGAVSGGSVSGGDTAGDEVSSDNSKLPYSVGPADKSAGFWSVFSKPYVIDANGTPLKVKFDIESDMANVWDNFLLVFTNQTDLNEATRGEAYAEYAVIRADKYGWCGPNPNVSLSGKTIEFTGDDVNTEVLKNATVELEISRAADVITIKSHAVSKTDASQTYDFTATLDVAGAGDVYCSLSLEKAYMVINTVEGEGTATGNAGNPVVAGQTTKKSLMFTDATYKSGKVTGTLNAENATVEVQVGSAAAQKATVNGKTFSLNVGTVKAGTTIKITASAEGYMSATKTLTVSKAKKKAIKLSGVKAKGKKVTGKVSVKKATVKVKVGKAGYKKAKVSGKKFTLTTKKMKKGTKVIVKATKSGYKAAKKTVKAK